jgi:hypothetical protein
VKKPENRSIAGALLMILIVPLFAGLMACMPVPIGDPERSRIDPEISGVWFLETDDGFDALYQLRPYDKRTWLMIGVPLNEGDAYKGEPLGINTIDDAIAALEAHDIGDEGITADATRMFKVWLAKIRGQVFMTWEMVGGFDEDGFEAPEIWYVFRVEKQGKDRIELFMVNADHETFEGLEEPDGDYHGYNYPRDVRRKWERALRKVAKNIDDEELYLGPWVLQRVPESLLDDADALFEEVLAVD